MASDFQELGRKPISDAAPTGAACREDALFEKLQNEFRKLELPELPRVEWGEAITHASTLLDSVSKDMLVGCYLALALLERDGFTGFADGLGVLRDMSATYWDTMFPERPKGRHAALRFLCDRGALRVGQIGYDGSSPEALQRMQSNLESLMAIVAEKLEGGGDSLDSLAREVRTVVAAGAAPPPSPEAAAQSSSSSSFASPSSPSMPSSIGSIDQLDQAIDGMKPALQSLGGAIRSLAPADAWGYRLPRIAAWLKVRNSPPSNGGQTSIPPPDPADIGQRLEQMVASQAWPGVLEETESRIAMSVFWLDLHYFAYTALRGIGATHHGAADGVALEVRQLLKRAPELPELKFASGAPLASEPARAWIQEKVLAEGGSSRPTGAGAVNLSPESGSFEGLEAAIREAGDMAQGGDISRAVARLEAGAARATRARERAAWKVALARLCVDLGRADVGLAQLEALHDDLRSTTIDQWDPELASGVLRLTLWARQKLGPSSAPAADEAQTARELLKRLARLDAASALELSRQV